MAFYSLVPFEGQMWLIKAEESQALNEEQLSIIDEQLKEGKTLQAIQESLDNVWSQK